MLEREAPGAGGCSQSSGVAPRPWAAMWRTHGPLRRLPLPLTCEPAPTCIGHRVHLGQWWSAAALWGQHMQEQPSNLHQDQRAQGAWLAPSSPDDPRCQRTALYGQGATVLKGPARVTSPPAPPEHRPSRASHPPSEEGGPAVCAPLALRTHVFFCSWKSLEAGKCRKASHCPSGQRVLWAQEMPLASEASPSQAAGPSSPPSASGPFLFLAEG